MKKIADKLRKGREGLRSLSTWLGIYPTVHLQLTSGNQLGRPMAEAIQTRVYWLTTWCLTKGETALTRPNPTIQPCSKAEISLCLRMSLERPSRRQSLSRKRRRENPRSICLSEILTWSTMSDLQLNQQGRLKTAQSPAMSWLLRRQSQKNLKKNRRRGCQSYRN